VDAGWAAPWTRVPRLLLVATLLGAAWLSGVDDPDLGPLTVALVLAYVVPLAVLRGPAALYAAMDLAAASVTVVLVPDLRAAVAVALLLSIASVTIQRGPERGLLTAAVAVLVLSVGEVVAASTASSVVLVAIFVVACAVLPRALTAITSTYHLAAGRLRQLTEALTAVEADPDLSRMLESVGELARSAVGGRYGAVVLVEEDRVRLDLASAAGTAAWGSDEGSLELDGGPAVEAVRTGDVVLVTDVETDPRAAPWARSLRAQGVGAVVAVPLRVEGEVIGALSVGLPDAGGLGHGDVELLRSFGQAATLHILRGRSTLAAELATAELEEAARERSAFTAAVAHDLRAPLTTVKGFIDTVRAHQGRLDAADIGRMLEVASRNADSLSRRIETLLQFTRLEGGRLTVALEEVDLAPAVRLVVEDCVGELGRHRVEVAIDDVRVVTDVVALSHVLGNLLENAAKYSPAGSLITVRARLGDGDVRVEVQDQGPGVSAEDRERIFESFERGAGVEGPGTGLGLAIAHRYVELWGGEIGLDDDDEGACFWFTIPLAGRPGVGAGAIRTARWSPHDDA
jgi:signal transduction histidine kinase